MEGKPETKARRKPRPGVTGPRAGGTEGTARASGASGLLRFPRAVTVADAVTEAARVGHKNSGGEPGRPHAVCAMGARETSSAK